MRIALVGDWLGPDGVGGGGVAQVVRSLADAYERLNCEVFVFYPRRKGVRLKESRKNLIPFGMAYGPQALFYWTVNSFDLARVLAKHSFDVVHLHGAAGWGACVRAPILYTAHGDIPAAISARGGLSARILGEVSHEVERRCSRKFDSVTAQNVSAGTRFFDRDFYVVPNPIAARFFGEDALASRSEGPLRLIVVARIAPEKGILDAIEWFASIADSDWTLTIVGNVVDHDYHRRCIGLLSGSSAKVFFVSPHDQSDVIDELVGSDVLILPSLIENSPLVIAEALAIGLPVIAKNVGAVSEMLEGVCGCVVVDSLLVLTTKSVSDVVRNSGRDRLARLARRECARIYEPRVVAHRFLELLSAIRLG